MTVIDVTAATFPAEVVARSATTPVVVDFWAEWCGPCRALGPLLERAALERDGDVVLAKLDTDANPAIATEYRIQGIPAVKAFRDGQVVDEFVGVQPPATVAGFFDRLVPSEADRLVAAGDEPSLRSALALHPTRADAAVALAEVLGARGERTEALALVAGVPGFRAEGLAARLRLEEAGAYAEGFAALDAGDTAGGLDLLLDALPRADGAKDDLRRVVVAVLDRLGVEHPLARDARRRLAAALY